RGFDSATIRSAAVVVLGEGLWRRRFGADPKVLNSTIRLDGQPYTVVGIMPAALDYPDGAEVWAPLGLERDPGERSAHNWAVIARLRPGVNPPQAERELNTLAARGTAAAATAAARR